MGIRAIMMSIGGTFRGYAAGAVFHLWHGSALRQRVESFRQIAGGGQWQDVSLQPYCAQNADADLSALENGGENMDEIKIPGVENEETGDDSLNKENTEKKKTSNNYTPHFTERKVGKEWKNTSEENSETNTSNTNTSDSNTSGNTSDSKNTSRKNNAPSDTASKTDREGSGTENSAEDKDSRGNGSAKGNSGGENAAEGSSKDRPEIKGIKIESIKRKTNRPGSSKSDSVNKEVVNEEGTKKQNSKKASEGETTKKAAGDLKDSIHRKMKDNKIPRNLRELNEYIDPKKLEKRKKLLIYLLVMAGLIACVLVLSTILKYHTWSSYSVLTSDDEEDTLSYSYTYAGKNILRYGIDSCRLMDADYNILWSDSYAMSNPAVEVCGETICIYDRSGSSIITYGKDGRIGSASSSLPIVKAAVAEQGVVAVICESSSETWIKYYSTDGSEIASFRTDMNSPGYPMDLALSPDGLSMTVSYAFVEAGQIDTQVAFYNFGSFGQNLVDNLIKVETYNDILAPDVEYISNSTCIVYFENGFRVFEGVRKPTQVCYISMDQTILSYSASEKGVVLVLKNENSADYTLKMFNLRGKGIFTGVFDFAYDGMAVERGMILFYNNQELMLYSMSGVCKFEGPTDEGVIKNALDLSKNRYLLVTDQGIRTIRLK